MAASRRLIVGVIGGDHNMDLGQKFGGEVTRRGWILLSGGEARPRADILRGEVKDAVMLGAAEAEGARSPARLIGILPSREAEKPCWRRPSRHRLFLDSGLPHNIRNVINGRTPDVLVAFGGGCGTLAEMAFALAAGRPVFVHGGFERLRKNFEAYFGPDAEPAHREIYLAAPMRIYPCAEVAELLAGLRQMFEEGPSPDVEAFALAERIAATIRVGAGAGFPGLPGEPDATERFARIAAEISQ